MTKITKSIKQLRQMDSSLDMKQLQTLFDTLQTMNENMLFIQRNQCEVEAYLSMIAEKVDIDKQELQKRIEEIEKQFDD